MEVVPTLLFAVFALFSTAGAFLIFLLWRGRRAAVWAALVTLVLFAVLFAVLLAALRGAGFA